MTVYSLNKLAELGHREKEVVIEGVLGSRETMSIIAPQKVGKTHLAIQLAVAVASGGDWIGLKTKKGKVLIVNTQQHADSVSEIANRTISFLGLNARDIGDKIDIVNLFEKPRSTHDISNIFSGTNNREYKLIIVDDFNNLIPSDVDETSNAEVSSIYVAIDSVADSKNTSFVLIHNSIKNANRGATGSGIGSQARACDACLVLIGEEDPKSRLFQVNISSRSFPPMNDFGVMFDWPIWKKE